ncbi:serine/threonine-protein kinase [Phytohabitans rumicis]|uniref:serine/threonine-protein kinase n=1 Tax=Phytohabitans rumicis TaxID=1076125 RepID=UPI00156326F3|nr:serine/threonine-protein kinase [Phytohabitans rumicis]
MSSFQPGLRLHDRFTLVERIGLGGMSEVWRAGDAVLDRHVAVKVLAAPVAVDHAATWREARAAARLAHPHVTQVYDYGEAPMPDGSVVPYLVMELVDGQLLADRLRAGALPWPEAARMAAQVAGALAAAHRLGVVHRDVKPGNVMLTAAGAKVLDFGIAALLDRPEPERGLVVGTPGYVAPERLAGAAAEPASDVYALGVLLHEALTGRPPRPGAAPDVPGLPPDIAHLCRACTAAQPADRPTAAEVAARLGSPAVAPAPVARFPSPPTIIERLPARREPNRLLQIGLAGAVMAIGLTVAVVAAALYPDGSTGAAQPGPTATATVSPTPPASTAPPTTPPPSAPAAVLVALDRTVTEALNDGRMDRRAARRLRDRIDKLREDVQDGESDEQIRDRVRDLLDDIDDQADEGRLDERTANELRDLVAPLLVA